MASGNRWLRAPALQIALLLLLSLAAGPLSAGGPEAYSALKFRSIGPSTGGRVPRATGVPGDPLTFYAATAQGGVWKSDDGGYRWKPIFDDQPVASMGSIAVAPSDPNVIYVGSGEANIRGNVLPGDGIYKSTDGGKSWRHVFAQVGQIGKMIVHPTNPDIAFAAVFGHAFGANPERGVYRTTDGGATWKQVLKRDADTGASDVSFDPQNPHILFAGLWQARRYPWGMTSGGPGSGLYRSADGGETWQQLTAKGLPGGIWGKVGVAVAPSDGRRVYALIEAENGGLYRSDDGGESWSWVNGHRALRQRAWYYSCLTVDPTRADVVWFPQVPMLRTIDGGKSVQYVAGLDHGDHHDVWIDPVDPRRMIASNDGGVELSVDGGKTWRAPRLPISQFYNIDVDNRVPYHLGGTMQDLGTSLGPSNSLHRNGIPLAEWHGAGGGEAGDFAFDPAEEGHVYAGEYGGILTHYDEATRQARNVSVYPTNPSGHGGEDLEVRFQWTAPIATSPHDPRELYHGANVLFRSTDRGQTWTAISPDLTRNDKSKQKWSGGPITGDNTGVEIYCTIFSIALSPAEKGVIWVGSDDGLVHVSRDAGASWQKVTPPGFPEWATVEGIEASRFTAGTAYVAVDAHRLDDPRPYVFKTTDYGKTWVKITDGLAADSHIYVVREDSRDPQLLFAGSGRGISFSRNGGKSWEPLKLNLPTLAVTDLVVKGDDLVVGTTGRSLWILDDFSPLRRAPAELEAKKLDLLAARPAYRFSYDGSNTDEGLGANPPRGAILYYHLKDKVEGEATLEITDSKGRLVRKLSSVAEVPEYAEDDPDDPTDKPEADLSIEAGLHRAVWDLHYEGADRLDKAKVDNGNPRRGPFAPPGVYRLKLSAGGETAEGELQVLPDPRGKATSEALAAQLDMALSVREGINRTTHAIRQVRAIREQTSDLARRLAGRADATELATLAAKVAEKATALEEKLHNPKAQVTYDILAFQGGTKLYSNLAFVFDTVEDGDGAPTQGAQEVYTSLLAELLRYEHELQELRATDLARLDQLATGLSLPRVLVP